MKALEFLCFICFFSCLFFGFFFFSSRRRHTRSLCDWSSDVCSSDLCAHALVGRDVIGGIMLAHVASYEGVCAVENIAGHAPRTPDYHAVPNCIYTEPERSEERRVGKECRAGAPGDQSKKSNGTTDTT